MDNLILKANEIVKAIGFELPRFIRLLCIDDSAEDFALLKRILEYPSAVIFEIEHVNDYDTAMQAIQKNTHDVYLVDFLLGNKNGLALINECAKNGHFGPFVVWSGYHDEAFYEQALRQNISGFIPKNCLLFGSHANLVISNLIRYSIKNHRIGRSSMDFIESYNKYRQVTEKQII